jgi:hypothetical protein
VDRRHKLVWIGIQRHIGAWPTMFGALLIAMTHGDQGIRQAAEDFFNRSAR